MNSNAYFQDSHGQKGESGQQGQQPQAQSYPQGYGYYTQHHQYYQQQQNASAAAAAAVTTLLPPSYSTPLPPPKAKPNRAHGMGSGVRRPSNNSGNPLSQYQAQYQSSMQLGAAAASAATAALLGHFGGSGNGNDNQKVPSSDTFPKVNGADSSMGTTTDEWYSSYQRPSHQQRMAATAASSTIETLGHPKFPPQSNRGRGSYHSQHRGGSHQPRHGNHQARFNNRNANNAQRGPRSNTPRGQHQGHKHNAPSGSPNGGSANSDLTVAAAAAGGGALNAAASESGETSTGFHCDACDVTFHEEAKLKVHKSNHRTCPDCQYAASPSLVAEHRKLTHKPNPNVNETDKNSTSSGTLPTTATASQLSAPSTSATTTAGTEKEGSVPSASSNRAGNRAQRLKPVFIKPEFLHPLTPKFNTPEDIASWIALRRKHWPTEANIQKKEQEKNEMIAKGQIVDSPQNGKRKNNSANKRENPQENAESLAKKPKLESTNSGLVSYASSVEDSSEADADTQELNGANGSLENNGGDMDVDDNENNDNGDEDMDPVRDAVSSKDPSTMGKVLLPSDRRQDRRSKKPCKYFLRGKCNKGDQCVFSHDPSFSNKIQKPTRAIPTKNVAFRSRPSLLERLLTSEIKGEKNVLLEALRYIVDNDYFDPKQPSGVLVQEMA